MTGAQGISLYGLRFTKGPTPELARMAIIASVNAPAWKGLQDQEGRRRLVGRLCEALMADPSEESWAALQIEPMQPAPVFAGQLLAATAIHLQNVAGHPVSRFRVLEDKGLPDPEVAWEYLLPRTGEAAGEAAAALLDAAAGPQGEAGEPIPVQQVEDLVARVTSAVANSVVEVLLTAAYRRGIPFHVIDPVFPMIAFGQGSATKRLMTSMTHSQGHISTLLTKDKMLALQILRESGFPVPSHQAVRSPEMAIEAAERLGYPVVVKPVDLMRSQGVSVNLTTPQAVSEAFEAAHKLSPNIIVEEHLPGLPYRILVIDGQGIAAMRRSVPMVVGDGLSSIAQLIATTNLERLRMSLQRSSAPRPIDTSKFEDELNACLTEQGLTMDSIPEAGTEVQLAFMARGGRGGENLDVTYQVHPDNLALAEDAAQIFEVDAFGLDLVTDNISRSYKEGRCGINEVNNEPALSLHLVATRSPRDVVTPFLDMEFGPGGRGSIPILCRLEDSEGAHFAMLERALSAAGLQPGLASGQDDARTGRYRLPRSRKFERPSARILTDLRVDVALLSLTQEDFTEGLAFDRCSTFLLPRASAAGSDRQLIEWSRLLAEELAEIVLMAEQDCEFWHEHLDLSGPRVILISRQEGSGNTPGPGGGELVRLISSDSVDVFYHHDVHVDRLLTGGRLSQARVEKEEQLLLTVASLLSLDWHPREISRLVQVHLTEPAASAQ